LVQILKHKLKIIRNTTERSLDLLPKMKNESLIPNTIWYDQNDRKKHPPFAKYSIDNY
jgi:hypothetical protein